MITLFVIALCVPLLRAQTPADATSAPVLPEPGTLAKQDLAAARKAKAEQQLKKEEHQRILGVMPEFNTSNDVDAVPLTAKQKFSLAYKSAIDPASFLTSALVGGFGQLTASYHEYGQGVEGYAKYFGAAYADSFDGTMLGNAIFPALLHEDPRYFRKGSGGFRKRAGYAILTTVRCKTDSGKWAPNYGNVLGNLAAGGISNLYYPEEDRGALLTFERAFTVTAEGAIGAMFYEFWPDVAHHFRKKRPSP